MSTNSISPAHFFSPDRQAASLALIACAVYSHGIAKYQAAAVEGRFAFPVLFFVIVTVVILFAAKFYYHPEAEESK